MLKYFMLREQPPRDQVFSEKKGVSAHLIYRYLWSFLHKLERGPQTSPPFEDRGALGLAPK